MSKKIESAYRKLADALEKHAELVELLAGTSWAAVWDLDALKTQIAAEYSYPHSSPRTTTDR